MATGDIEVNVEILHKYGSDPQFAPQFVINVFDVLVKTGGGASISDVEEMLAPEDSAIFGRHLQLAIKLGLFASIEGNIEIPATSTVGHVRLTPQKFSRYMRDVLIVAEPPQEMNSLQALFVWAHSILPLHELDGKRNTVVPKSWKKFEEFGIGSGLIGEGLVIKGDTQYPPTRRWLEAFGVVVDGGKDTYMLCYDTLLEEILELFPVGRISIRDFVTKLRNSLPHLPGGRWNNSWGEVVRQKHVVNPNLVATLREHELTEIESVALNVLKNSGRVNFFEMNDAPDKMKISIVGTDKEGADQEMVTHLEFKAMEVSQ